MNPIIEQEGERDHMNEGVLSNDWAVASAKRLERPTPRDQRGSILIVALLIMAILGISLVSYLSLGSSLLKQAHRTYFADSALNYAELGLEQAAWSFNQMASGVDKTAAWSAVDSAHTAWTCDSTANTATLSMPAFTLDQNASCKVKVYVNGYDGSAGSATVASQATITPFDGGSPIVKIVEVKMMYSGRWAYGLVAQNDITWNGHPSADSFISTTNVASGPYASYPVSVVRPNTTLGSTGGSISLGAGGVVHGNILLGSGSVSGGTVTGSTTTGFSYSFTVPVCPTASSVTQSYSLGSTVPSSLPRESDLAASDGKFYYFTSGARIGSLKITSGDNVVIVGSGNTSVSVGGSSGGGGSGGHGSSDDSEGDSSSSGITINPSSKLTLYLDGPVSASGNGVINNNSWAGALKIYTTTASACSIGGNGTIYACLFAPNAALTCDGGGSSGMLVGSFVANSITSNGHMDFHYDEALKNETDGKAWVLSGWREMQSAAERATYASIFGAFR